MPEPPKVKKSLFGCFSDPPVITTDPDPKLTDPYVKKDFISSRYLGKSLVSPAPPSGRLPKSYLGKTFLTLASREQNGPKAAAEVYEDPGRSERRAAAESKKKNIVDRDFKYVSFPKQSTGPGSFAGCFQAKPFEHLPAYKVPKKDDVPDRPKPQLPNIKTRPAKKGTFGFAGTLFEKPAAFDPNRKGDDFDALRKQERAAWEESKKKNIGGIFKLAGTGKKTFDEKPHAGVSSVFDNFEPKEDPKKKARKPKAAATAPAPKEPLKPFRYASPGKSGETGCLNKFPNTRPDPKAADPYDSVRLKRKEEKAKAPKPLGGTWKPVSGPKSSVISSLLRRFY